MAATVAANTTYTLDFYLGQRLDFAFSAYTVSLIANGVTLASDSAGSPAAGTFVSRSITYNSGAAPLQLGQTLSIAVTAGASGGQANFDDFTLDGSPTSSTPEPATAGLGALAILGFFSIRARRRSA